MLKQINVMKASQCFNVTLHINLRFEKDFKHQKARLQPESVSGENNRDTGEDVVVFWPVIRWMIQLTPVSYCAVVNKAHSTLI